MYFAIKLLVLVLPPGIEPGFSGLQSDVLPLNYGKATVARIERTCLERSISNRLESANSSITVNVTQIVKFRVKVPRGIEPRSLDSESNALTIVLWDQFGLSRLRQSRL